MDSSGKQAERPKKKAHRKDEKYIHEDADTIVDLADIRAMSKISCKFRSAFHLFSRVGNPIFLNILFIITLQHRSLLKMLPKHRQEQLKRVKMQIVVSKQISVGN